jgi:hypothetical protein
MIMIPHLFARAALMDRVNAVDSARIVWIVLQSGVLGLYVCDVG